jgi:uncharacterized protein (TIGR02453 family)
MAFTGFTEEALDFYRRLEVDNSKAFWQANRATYVTAVREPMAALTGELADLGPFHLFRPHNDLRFSKQRPPYKTHQGAYVESEGGAGYYVQLSASGLMLAAGYYAMAPDQLTRFRDAVGDDRTGSEVATIAADLRRRHYTIGAIAELATAPRGWPRDHPRIDLLRRKGLMASMDVGAPAWIRSRGAVRRIRAVWDGTAGLCAWLDTHVGPSTLPPDDLR